MRASLLLALCLSVPLSCAAASSDACGSQAGVAPAQRLSNTVQWTTASEEDNFGYDVYRADNEKGPFAKITREPILGNGTTAETHLYKYVDDSIDPCKDYWYYVESISTDGQREKFTDVFHAPAKRAPAPAAK